MLRLAYGSPLSFLALHQVATSYRAPALIERSRKLHSESGHATRSGGHPAQTKVLLDYIRHIMKPLLISLVLFLSIKTSAQECYDLSDQSNWISVVCYEQGILLMKMQGVVYQFCGVDRIVFDGLLRARSPGMYYDQVIRGRYGCQQQQSNDIYWTDPRGVRMYVPRSY